MSLASFFGLVSRRKVDTVVSLASAREQELENEIRRLHGELLRYGVHDDWSDNGRFPNCQFREGTQDANGQEVVAHRSCTCGFHRAVELRVNLHNARNNGKR